ncbi:MAG TPA: hypothetical protein PLK13_05210 [Xanthobacteraceae bacterium]|jgi:hypothetical protein|nr:MAG: hypothetical protein B7Z41_02460 [Rhizobiales bacterium 12-66-7]HQS08205.1 hypothetical protein [Xanthobacteraceae bacterium]HQS48533.1 hypothetical protein [Xanthobacteraceae bacterium]
METQITQDMGRVLSELRHRVLLIGDEYVLSSDIAAILRRHAFDVIGPLTFAAAQNFIRDGSHADCAVIDIHLHQPLLEPVAVHLRAEKVPLLFVATLGVARVPPSLADIPVWGDAFDHESITGPLHALLGARS